MKIRNENIKVVMMDDGYCEYDRCGVGVLDGKVFVCDLENIDFDDVLNENDLKCFWFVNFDSVEECCKSGVEFGWCKELNVYEGYGKDDMFRMKCYEDEDDGDVDGFDKWIEKNEVK